MLAMGVTIVGGLKEEEPELFSVWPENAPTLDLFLRMATQWRVAPMGGVIGFDYNALDVVIRRCEVECTPEMFDDLQAMERAALAVMNEKKDSS